MSIIHKKCGTKLISSGTGDIGFCKKCNKLVSHIFITKSGIVFSDEVEIRYDRL